MTRQDSLTRRDVLGALTIGSATVAIGCASRPATAAPAASATPTAPAAAGPHSVLALPFKAGALRGISERLIVSHHDNNYSAAVRNLNRVEQELARLATDAPPFMTAALRQSELGFRNSKTLHEAYFGNLGGDGRRSGPIDAALTGAFGSAARWEEQFRATGLGLGGGSGWVVLGLELDTGSLRIVGSGHHTQMQTMSVPLLVMDMYEHSYQMDYGAEVAPYIDAFFANLQWEEVNRRFVAGQSAARLLRQPSAPPPGPGT